MYYRPTRVSGKTQEVLTTHMKNATPEKIPHAVPQDLKKNPNG